MSFYISQATTQPQSQPNGLPSQGVDPLIIFIAGIVTTCGAGFGAFLLKASNSDVVSKTVTAKINQKQAETNAVVAEKLTDNNIELQFAEARIDQSAVIGEIAKAGVNNSAEANKELLSLLKASIEAQASHAQSTQLLTEAKKHHAEATADIAKAMMHVAEALQSLTQAQEVLPTEIKLAIEIYANEFRGVLEEIREELKTHDQKSERRLNLMETRIKEQYTDVTAQVRRDLALIKCHKPD